jgi:hypothetical protein
MTRPSHNEVARAYAVLKTAKTNAIVKVATRKVEKYKQAMLCAEEEPADVEYVPTTPGYCPLSPCYCPSTPCLALEHGLALRYIWHHVNKERMNPCVCVLLAVAFLFCII